MAYIGLNDLHYALITRDSEGKIVYGEPKKLAPAITVSLSITTASGTLYGDDAIQEQIDEFVSGSLKIKTTDLKEEDTAILLGQEVDGAGVTWAGANDKPPEVAIGFRAKKTGGKYRYQWLLRNQFKVPGEEYNTKEDKIAFQTPEIEATIMLVEETEKWQAKKVTVPTDTVAEHWFDNVIEYTAPSQGEE